MPRDQQSLLFKYEIFLFVPSFPSSLSDKQHRIAIFYLDFILRNAKISYMYVILSRHTPIRLNMYIAHGDSILRCVMNDL